jgi:glutamate racemase
MATRTIAVFDSGFGGLTVLRALRPLLTGTRFVYLGDTARLPYGAKSRETIVRYALSSAAFLLAQGAEMLVVACNTASALALDDLQQALPIPVVGVIAPGVEAAAEHRLYLASESAQVLVLATAATVQSGAYAAAFTARGITAYEKACPLLVPLVEEGWIDHPVTAEVLRIYLREAFADAPLVTTLVLGCTHYPLLKPLIERTLAELDHPMDLVDSASATAHAAAALLPPSARTEDLHCTFYATDSVQKFQRLGSSFLGEPLPPVHLIDLGG